MARKLFPILACLLIFLASGARAQRRYAVIALGRPVPGAFLTHDGTVYAPLVPLALDLKVAFSFNVNKLTVNGKPFRDFVTRRGAIFVSLKPFANLAGYKLMVNDVTKVIHVLRRAR